MEESKMIRALAELDGRMAKEIKPYAYAVCEGQYGSFNGDQCLSVLPCYLHSYDAIIPLIQRQDVPTRTKIAVFHSIAQNKTARIYDYIMLSPSQLCEALLRATGKWIE